MDRMSASAHEQGVTLIELLVVMLIASLALVTAVPLMREVVHRVQVNVESLRLLSAINLARTEAVLRSAPVTLCPSQLVAGGASSCAGRYADGWIIQARTGARETLHAFGGVPRGFSVRNSADTRDAYRAINFLPDGTSRSNQTLRVCPPLGSEVSSLAVVVNIVGRARLEERGGPCFGA